MMQIVSKGFWKLSFIKGGQSIASKLINSAYKGTMREKMFNDGQVWMTSRFNLSECNGLKFVSSWNFNEQFYIDPSIYL